MARYSGTLCNESPNITSMKFHDTAAAPLAGKPALYNGRPIQRAFCQFPGPNSEGVPKIKPRARTTTKKRNRRGLIHEKVATTYEKDYDTSEETTDSGQDKRVIEPPPPSSEVSQLFCPLEKQSKAESCGISEAKSYPRKANRSFLETYAAKPKKQTHIIRSFSDK